MLTRFWNGVDSIVKSKEIVTMFYFLCGWTNTINGNVSRHPQNQSPWAKNEAFLYIFRLLLEFVAQFGNSIFLFWITNFDCVLKFQQSLVNKFNCLGSMNQPEGSFLGSNFVQNVVWKVQIQLKWKKKTNKSHERHIQKRKKTPLHETAQRMKPIEQCTCCFPI